MYRLPAKERPMLYPFFEETCDNLVRSCLEGHMGEAIVDDPDSPACVLLVVGDFCYFAGDAAAKKAIPLLESLSNYYCGNPAIALPCHEGWAERFTQVYGEGCTSFTRYAFHKQEQFDTAKLRAFTHALPAGYSLHPINDALYHQCLSQDWSRDLCSQFASAEDYAARGLGFGVVYEGELVAGASAYAIFDGGIEIEIDTRMDHRRLGLAAACGAALILECLQRNLIPSWDAANLASVSLAEKLGYRLNKPYTAYLLPLQRD